MDKISPTTNIAVVDDVGASPNGHTSIGAPILITKSDNSARLEFKLDVIDIILCSPIFLDKYTVSITSLVLPEFDNAIKRSPEPMTPKSPCAASPRMHEDSWCSSR